MVLYAILQSLYYKFITLIIKISLLLIRHVLDLQGNKWAIMVCSVLIESTLLLLFLIYYYFLYCSLISTVIAI